MKKLHFVSFRGVFLWGGAWGDFGGETLGFGVKFEVFGGDFGVNAWDFGIQIWSVGGIWGRPEGDLG